MRRRRRFGSSAVTSSQTVARRKTKCRACGGEIAIGDTVVRLRLKKHLRGGCVTCGHKLTGIKWYHDHCAPADPQAAMGYSPGAPPSSDTSSVKVPPPQKPRSADDLFLAALVALEDALRRKVAGDATAQAALEKEFKTYQGIKARALRPGTPAEGVTALKMALNRAVAMCLS